jgi:uncharacterized lipoprotein YmbA
MKTSYWLEAMTTNKVLFLRLLGAASCLLVAAGCQLLPKPQADPTRYYVLTGRSPGTAAPAGSPTVQLRPVELAAYLRNRPMVVRKGETEIEIRDYARWGEPLEQGIARVLREELAALGIAVLNGTQLDAATGSALSVRVAACEGTTAGAVEFRATWQVQRPGDKPATVASGDYRAEGLSWDGKTEAGLAARLSEAVAGLAVQIAKALAASQAR